jgi:hypothetical protein
MHDVVLMLLQVAFRHAITAPNVESGFSRIRALTESDVEDAILAKAIDTCVAASWVREPVRLPEGALQCHWRLELTPQGVAAARAHLTRAE